MPAHQRTHHTNSSTPLSNTLKPSKHKNKQYCLYCKKATSELARDLESTHSGQPDVTMTFSFNKGSRERRDLICSLRKCGNFDHNATVASCAGEMVAYQRPTSAKQSDDYRHCKLCQGLYARDWLWRREKLPSEVCWGRASSWAETDQPRLTKTWSKLLLIQTHHLPAAASY